MPIDKLIVIYLLYKITILIANANGIKRLKLRTYLRLYKGNKMGPTPKRRAQPHRCNKYSIL